jgi:uncharacterized protein with HEPN domain
MSKDPIIAIRDCLVEIVVLQDIARRLTLDDFRSDPIARRAAAYAIQTISEAVRRIPDEWLAEHSGQPWAQIRSIGNRLRHEYCSAMSTFVSMMPFCGRSSPWTRSACGP